MSLRRIRIPLVILAACGSAFAAGSPDVEVRTTRPEATATVDQLLPRDRALVTVVDGAENPVIGLKTQDFAVSRSGRQARIVAVQPLSEVLEVPRHLVLVLDNSGSMKERKAIDALLQGVGEVLKIVRPVDDVRMIVFTDRSTVKLGGRDLHVRTLQSSDPSELGAFASEAYGDVTVQTFLYEGILAGLELMKEMPVDEPRFLVVFSDGEDINSAFGRDEVTRAAQGLVKPRAYAIDYMPVPEKDEFLSKLTAENRGQIWKATSQTNLVPIFQKVAEVMQVRYVVTYRFPATGTVAVSPAVVNVDEVFAGAGGAEGAPSKGATLKTGIDEAVLKVRPQFESDRGIARWGLLVRNGAGNVAHLWADGAPPAEIEIPLPTRDLDGLAGGGDLTVNMEVEEPDGERLMLTAPPVRVNVTQSRASLSVSPGALTIDEIRLAGEPSASRASIDNSVLTVRPAVESPAWIARWSLAVENAGGRVTELAGTGAPPAELSLPLPVGDLAALGGGGDLAVRMELQGAGGQAIQLPVAPVKVQVLQTRAGLAVTPASLTVEEIKTIDSSPMLGHVYFEKCSAEIPERYKRLGGAAETGRFEEEKLYDSLEKHHQVLNVVGRRLVAEPSAKITLVGCNDATAQEKKTDGLSLQRAHAVKEYLTNVWAIAPERVSIEARGLPRTPSTSGSEEGRAENRRVEIVSSTAAVCAPIQSVYTVTRTDTAALTLRPEVVSPHGVDRWQVACANGAGTLAELEGKGSPAEESKILIQDRDLKKLASGGDLNVKLEVLDRKGQRLELPPVPVKVNLAHVSQRLVEDRGQKHVQEKYALILFAFDEDTITAPNREVLEKIAGRIEALPQATVEIVGHTDNIGSDAYNLKLSERRARTAYQKLLAIQGGAGADRMRYSGVGAKTPLYDNLSPETRALNRTVVIVLDYVGGE